LSFIGGTLAFFARRAQDFAAVAFAPSSMATDLAGIGHETIGRIVPSLHFFQGISMSLSMYQASVPSLIRYLKNISTVLDKGIAHAEAKKIDPAVLANYRLAADMFPLIRQIQIMSDGAKGCGARLAGIEVPTFQDTETSLEQLKERIAKTVAFLEGLKAEQFEGAETRDISLKAGPRELKFKGVDYLFGFVLPNFYFHATAAYAILRHAGVEVGKMDFLGQL